MPKTDIKHIRIEPADDGGFMTEVCYRPKPKKEGAKGPMMPMDYDENVKKHVHASGKDLGEFITGLFPGAVARTKHPRDAGDAPHGTTGAIGMGTLTMCRIQQMPPGSC